MVFSLLHNNINESLMLYVLSPGTHSCQVLCVLSLPPVSWYILYTFNIVSQVCSPATASTQLLSVPPTPFPLSMSPCTFSLICHSHNIPSPHLPSIFSWRCTMSSQSNHLTQFYVSHWYICVSWPMCSASMHSTLKLWYPFAVMPWSCVSSHHSFKWTVSVKLIKSLLSHVNTYQPILVLMMYKDLPLKCKQCVRWLADDEVGWKACDDHLDSHVRQNTQASL